MKEGKKFQEVVYEIMKERDGRIHLHEIYVEVKKRLADLCDESIRCIHQGVDYGQPEWKHRVRNAQQSLKRRGLIEPSGSGYWRVRA